MKSSNMFNFVKYRDEVAKAQNADSHRRLVDDTKKRAVYQAANYNEFQSLVATCHLKPLEKDSLVQRNLPPRLNRGFAADATDFYLSKPHTQQEPVHGTDQEQGRPYHMRDRSRGLVQCSPTTQAAFLKHWRNCRSDEERIQWLETVSSATLESVFRVEIDADLLLEIVRTIRQAYLTCPRASEDHSTDMLPLKSSGDVRGLDAVPHKDTSCLDAKSETKNQYACDDTEDEEDVAKPATEPPRHAGRANGLEGQRAADKENTQCLTSHKKTGKGCCPYPSSGHQERCCGILRSLVRLPTVQKATTLLAQGERHEFATTVKELLNEDLPKDS